ncbi:short-chain dehydrogenase [Thioclava sp. SK-1]|uniref:SDR family oxidoreductase n=1 Tax=Thioclava sp. SK-1 TaxID=1889770 RepID=UPI000825CE71|nr:SDR family oxidoreductase [Thioclava sp. SK-1]OCX66640.1 short-chain dehydrogenase [Thioclava sp. SK-1]
MSKTVLILGARSLMAQSIARRFAQAGYGIRLAARCPDSLSEVQSELATLSGQPVTLHDFDVLQTEGFEGFLDGLPQLPDIAICAVGTMNDQGVNETDLVAATRDIRSNFEGPALILGQIATRMALRGSGTIVGISSVAGDRGRAANYVYGAAKAGFTAFLSGLRNRLARKGVHVLTVKPGFVATKMTQGMDLPSKLTAQPAEVGDAVFNAVTKGKDILYVRAKWRLIMLIICAIPEALFKKLSL